MLVWNGHRAKLRSLVFSPDGRTIATTAGNSKFVWLWDATTGKLIRKLEGAKYSATRVAAFFPDGEHVLGLHHHRPASVWNLTTGAIVAQLDVSSWYQPDYCAITPDGSRLLMFSGQQLAEWDDPTRSDPMPRRCDRHRPLPKPHYYFFPMGYSPGGKYFWGSWGTLSLFDAATFEPRRTFVDPDGASAMAVGFSQDESRVCVSFGHRAVVWRLDEAQAPPVKLRGHKQQVRAVGFLPGGGTVLTAAMDGTVRLWDANTGTEQRSFDWGIGKVRVAAVSPDGTMCAAGSDEGKLVVWDVDL
jgi:WD40 repeat protein